MKRMIAAILVLCMVLCSIPVAAAASFDEFFADVPATVENDASYPFAESDDETCLISGNKGMGGTTSALKLTFRSGGTFRFSYKVQRVQIRLYGGYEERNGPDEVQCDLVFRCDDVLPDLHDGGRGE